MSTYIMNTRRRLAAILAAMFILSDSFTVFAANADQMPEETITEQERTGVDDEEITDDVSLSEMTTISENGTESIEEDDALQYEALSVTEVEPYETDFPVPDEAPAFQAHIEFRQGYTVIGTFTDFTPDIILILPLYSRDGETWQTSAIYWNLNNLNTDNEYLLKAVQNQPCLFSTDEPLKSYIAGEIDRFYVKLRITRACGLSYETQSAVIERGGLQSIPEGAERRASFSSAIAASEPDPAAPRRSRKYGRYQLTISADATVQDVSALLPDTLPVEVQFDHGSDFIAIGVVDCPVTWKPLSLPQLSPGESITIPDAAEEILVPSGTLVSTPLGTFQLDEPLSLNTPPSTDEVRLVLNVSPEDRNPTGVLRAGKNGLEVAFHLSLTGAVSVHTYVLKEGESEWTKLSDLSLSGESSQPSVANSGYMLVLYNDQEPYCSYLAAVKAKETPTPFFIALKIEGGIYDGKQLILAWPDIYEQLPELPEVGGAGGNEGNAGADNKGDSTESGQRPNLPQSSNDDQKKQQSPSTYTSEAASAISENQNAPAAEGSKQSDPVSQKQEVSESGQQSEHPQTKLDSSDTSSDKTSAPANQESNLKYASFALPAVTDTKNEENAVILPNAETVIEHSANGNSHVPLLPLTASVLAVICIIAAVCKTTGYSPLHRIAGKIGNILHK